MDLPGVHGSVALQTCALEVKVKIQLLIKSGCVLKMGGASRALLSEIPLISAFCLEEELNKLGLGKAA